MAESNKSICNVGPIKHYYVNQFNRYIGGSCNDISCVCDSMNSFIIESVYDICTTLDRDLVLHFYDRLCEFANKYVDAYITLCNISVVSPMSKSARKNNS